MISNRELLNGNENVLTFSLPMDSRGVIMIRVCIQNRKMENGCTFPYM
jgi:hypothetical protein